MKISNEVILMDLVKMEELARAKLAEMLAEGPEDDDVVVDYIRHHLEEVEAEYWQDQFGSVSPSYEDVLAGMVMVNAWSSSSDDGPIDTLDFSLPGGTTQYVLAVRFEGDKISSVEMES